MERLLSNIHIKVNENIYLKDPESSELGVRIISSALDMIYQIGMENFTFKKLAKVLETTESSIYRYFENKHKLLIYLINYYWAFLEYVIVFQTHNLKSSQEQLRKALDLISDPSKYQITDEQTFTKLLSMEQLNAIVIAESSKAYLTKEVDAENKAGFFIAFKSVVRRLVEIILKIDSTIKFPNTLASTCIEGIIHQQFFAKHLPSLTDFSVEEAADKRSDIFYQMIMNNLKTQ